MTSFAALAGGLCPTQDDARRGIATDHARLLARLN
jgi:hypothetical protein